MLLSDFNVLSYTFFVGNSYKNFSTFYDLRANSLENKNSLTFFSYILKKYYRNCTYGGSIENIIKYSRDVVGGVGG